MTPVPVNRGRRPAEPGNLAHGAQRRRILFPSEEWHLHDELRPQPAPPSQPPYNNNPGGGPAYQQYPGQQSGGYMSAAPYGPSTEKNNLGGWALGLGIAGLVCCGALTGVPAIILGYLGIQAANQGRATNKGMSIAGVVLGAISVVLFIIAVATGALSDILNNLNS